MESRTFRKALAKVPLSSFLRMMVNS